jgi:hypothetical protein
MNAGVRVAIFSASKSHRRNDFSYGTVCTYLGTPRNMFRRSRWVGHIKQMHAITRQASTRAKQMRDPPRRYSAANPPK